MELVIAPEPEVLEKIRAAKRNDDVPPAVGISYTVWNDLTGERYQVPPGFWEAQSDEYCLQHVYPDQRCYKLFYNCRRQGMSKGAALGKVWQESVNCFPGYEK